MNLTPQQLLAVQEGEPFRFTVPDVTGEFIVVRADVFDRVKLLLDSGDFEPSEAMPLIWQAMKSDWEDPAMDVYDNYPEQK